MNSSLYPITPSLQLFCLSSAASLLSAAASNPANKAAGKPGGALYKGQLKLVSTDLKGPNGIAFSPDEKYLYIGNWDPEKKIIMRYEVSADATLTNEKIFFDMTQAPGADALDGIKVDRQGNLYVSGPGGLWIISPEAKHLGTIIAPRHPHNIARGGDDGKTLYMTAQGSLYRMPLNIPGIRPGQKVGDLSQAK